MAVQLACNINFYLYIRFVFGFYHEFQTPKPLRWLARCYCCFICASIIFCYNYSICLDIYSKHLVCLLSMEYVMYVSISLLKGNKYLLQYYKKTPLIDASASTYRQMHVCLIGYNCVMFLIRLCGFIKFLILHEECFADAAHCCFSLFDFIMWIIIITGRSPVLFVFALLYSRVRQMRHTLENNNFDCRNQGKHHPRRYIQMHEAIMDGLEASDGLVKLQLLVLVIYSTAHYAFGALFAFYTRKFDDTKNDDQLDFIWYIVEVIMSCLPLILSAVLADLVSMETQKMLVIVMGRRIDSKNERDREEVQKLYQFLKSNPFEYSLFRVVPLNVCSLLSFFSFTITTIIAILQIQEWTA